MNGAPSLEEASPLDFRLKEKIHLVGVGGTGMSSIAEALVEAGFEVSGSEIKESRALNRLRKLGVKVYLGQKASNVNDAEVICYSTAIPNNNVELVAARNLRKKVIHRSQVLAGLSKIKKTIAVAGTHGKTTTSSMTTLSLYDSKLSPTFVIGGEVNEVGAKASFQKGDWFVVEADESDGTFLHLEVEVGVVTSIEADHLDYYGSFDALVSAYFQFLNNAKIKVISSDDEVLKNYVHENNLYSVGFNIDSDFRIGNIVESESVNKFTLSGLFKSISDTDLTEIDLELSVLGRHNIKNASFSFIAALLAGSSIDATKNALARFGGVSRRFEWKGIKKGITFIDDYAHLPGEIVPTIATAKLLKPKRLIACFQPHRFSRIKSLKSSFKDSFRGADLAIITDIYAAGEDPIQGVTAENLYNSIKEKNNDQEVLLIKSREDLISYFIKNLREGDLLLTLGAGDITSLADEIMDEIEDEI